MGQATRGDLPGSTKPRVDARQSARHYKPGISMATYQFANVMFAPERPARLAADRGTWEMTTGGGSAARLGLGVGGSDGGENPREDGFISTCGMPTAASCSSRYEKVSGLSPENIDYYWCWPTEGPGIVLEKTDAAGM